MSKPYTNTEKVFLNGSLVPADQATLSAFDAGFLHGAGIFETMRAYAGQVYRLDQHLDRLIKSAKILSIPLALDKNSLRGAVEKTIQANSLSQARVRLALSCGDLRRPDPQTPIGTLLITASALTAYPTELYQKGMNVVISDVKLNSTDPLTRHKSSNYFCRLLVLRKAQHLGAGEALWFSQTNQLGEGCISNVFLVKDSTLLTPPLEEPILPGITRAAVLELAQADDIPTRQQPLVIDDLLEAEEIFLTNSIMEVMPVGRFEKHVVSGAQPGPLTQRVAEIYRQDVAQKCGVQS